MCFSNVCDFSFTNSMLVYSFESLSLKSMHGSGVLYLTMLAPFSRSTTFNDNVSNVRKMQNNPKIINRKALVNGYESLSSNI